MLWAQISILVLVFAGMLITANQHGKPKTGIEDFWTHLISVAIILILLYFAGGFSQIFH